jgi:hypothetical protein
MNCNHPSKVIRNSRQNRQAEHEGKARLRILLPQCQVIGVDLQQCESKSKIHLIQLVHWKMDHALPRFTKAIFGGPFTHEIAPHLLHKAID